MHIDCDEKNLDFKEPPKGHIEFYLDMWKLPNFSLLKKSKFDILMYWCLKIWKSFLSNSKCNFHDFSCITCISFSVRTRCRNSCTYLYVVAVGSQNVPSLLFAWTQCHVLFVGFTCLKVLSSIIIIDFNLVFPWHWERKCMKLFYCHTVATYRIFSIIFNMQFPTHA